MKKTILLFVLIANVCAYVHGQTDAKKEALAIIQKLADRYSSSKGLSFDIAYKYSLDDAPKVHIDSLFGQCRLLGNQYWYLLDSTESIRTSDFLIMVFREDSIIYLAKPSAQSAVSDPLPMMDSLLLKQENIRCQVTEGKSTYSLVLNFAGHPTYRRIEYVIDKQTGYLTRMNNIVKTKQFASDAIVEARFFNYREGGFDDSVFETKRYFKKEGNEYISVAPFEKYKIFLGSPGL